MHNFFFNIFPLFFFSGRNEFNAIKILIFSSRDVPSFFVCPVFRFVILILDSHGNPFSCVCCGSTHPAPPVHYFNIFFTYFFSRMRTHTHREVGHCAFYYSNRFASTTAYLFIIIIIVILWFHIRLCLRRGLFGLVWLIHNVLMRTE